MSPPDRLKVDDLPDSAYARELKRGTARLQFDDADLEAEFVADNLRRARWRLRVWLLMSFALVIVFTISQTLRRGLWSTTFWVHLLGIVPCAGALLWLTWSSYYERYYMPVARILVPVFGVLIAVFIAQSVAGGREEELAGLAVNVIAVFFFVGLLFRAALVAAAAILIAFMAAAVSFGLPFALAMKSMTVLIVTAVTGAIIYRDTEQSHRGNFLETAIIAELVTRDGLTGLTNRRAFDEHLLRVWQQGQRDRRTVALLMVDIDHFKAYNDVYGHQAGDAALRSVAQLLRGFARRPLDLAARYGGEEFVLILYDLPLPQVRGIADRARQAVQGTVLREGAPIGQRAVTVSIGVGVMVPGTGRSPQGAIQLADEALYLAKQAGRNCISVKGAEEYRGLNTGTFRGPAADRGES
ncbi:MAG: diguanylate cyclase domain-containing protein [Steroidobacterales bacterium]